MQRAVVADLLNRRQRAPASRSSRRTAADDRRCGRGCRARASRSGAPTPFRWRRPGRRPGARGRSRGRCRPRRRVVDVTSSSTKCTSEPARDSSFGITSTAMRTPSGCGQPLQLLDAAPRGVAAVRRSPAIARLRPRQAEMRHQHRDRNPPRDVQRALGFGHRPRARVADRRSRVEQRPLPAAAGEALGDRRVHAVQLEPGLGQPLLQVGDGRRVVVVEMRPRREHLDRLEAVRRDLEQVIAASAADCGRGASTSRTDAFGHQAKHSFYRSD